MSIFDNLKKLTQPYGDDEYEDEYEDEVDGYDEDPISRRSDFGTAPAADNKSGKFTGPVMNINSKSSKQEVVLFRPANFGETTKAADALRSNKAVVLNLENVDKAMSRRVVDFLSGCVYALSGSVKKIAQSAYIFCPHNMDVVGDLESLQAEVESYI